MDKGRWEKRTIVLALAKEIYDLLNVLSKEGAKGESKLKLRLITQIEFVHKSAEMPKMSKISLL